MVKLNRDNDDKKPNKRQKNPKKKLNVSIITCSELESDNRDDTIIVKNADNSLKRQDSAVLYFHTTNTLTRYNESELKDLRNNRLSQAPPPCMYQPNIIKLNILKFSNDHPKSYEEDCESFRAKLNNLSLSHWDPQFLELLQNYNNGYYNTNQPVLNPRNIPPVNNTTFFNSRRNNYFQQQGSQPRRHVSWNNHVDEIIDKRQDNYHGNNRPSNYSGVRSGENHRSTQMGGWNNGGRYRVNQNRNYNYHSNNLDTGNFTKMNYYQQKRNDYEPMSQNSSGNSFEKDASKESSIECKKDDDSELKKDGHLADDEEEPEWFAMPVSRLDTIELRGFDDDVCSTTTLGDDESGQHGQPSITDKPNPPARSTPTKRKEFCFDEFSNPRPNYEMGHHAHGYGYQQRRNPSSNQSRLPSWFNSNPPMPKNYDSGNYRTQNFSSTSNSSFNSSLNRSGGSGSQNGNFFDMWQRNNNHQEVRPNNENVNYLNQMHIQNQLINVGEIENRIKQNSGIYNLLTQIKQQQFQNRRRQSDFDKFLEKISIQNQKKFAYQSGMAIPFQQPMRHQLQMPQMPPQMAQANINGILETFRQMHTTQSAAHMRFPFQQQPPTEHKVPTITPEELMLHTQKIMQNAINRKQNEKEERNSP